MVHPLYNDKINISYIEIEFLKHWMIPGKFNEYMNIKKTLGHSSYKYKIVHLFFKINVQ